MLEAVGVLELNFRFLILQPIIGYGHFSCRISKFKQVAGRVHHNVQCCIIGLIVGIALYHFVTVIYVFIDV
ncbi:hypothetical protein BDR05DRAFT_895993 [Suillus weaverae]|nr:hypothetical protein BDR05DRAFT_895993 [Suillus weaverae]